MRRMLRSLYHTLESGLWSEDRFRGGQVIGSRQRLEERAAEVHELRPLSGPPFPPEAIPWEGRIGSLCSHSPNQNRGVT